MCGLNIIYKNNRIMPDRECLSRMNEALSHRGPDGDGVYLHQGIGLGHTRLSIVDVDSGQQPMSAQNCSHTIIYNGELYNYKKLRKDLICKGFVFKTNSDTEVVLSLYQFYGESCLQHMRGMFSFAVYEKISGKLFIARDRLGIKPFFYHWTGDTLIAASEIKAIFVSGYVNAKMCKASVINYFTYQFSITPNTPFESIYELAPGHCMTLLPSQEPKIRQYWDLDFPRHDEYENDNEQYWLEAFESSLTDAIKSHTIGDVPIGSYLSGGVDSCTVTELLTRNYSRPVKTFSIGFDDVEHDESLVYHAVANHLGVENCELLFTAKNDYLTKFKDSLYHLEQPQRMSVDIPHFELSKVVRSQNYKVVCTGDGADEILAGYDCFRQDSMRTASNTMIGRFFRCSRYLKKYTEYFAEDHMRMLLSLHSRKAQRETIDKYGFYPAWYDFWQIPGTQLDALFLEDVVSEANPQAQMDAFIQQMLPKIKQRHPLNQSLYFETKSRLPGWILWKSDRLSMAHGVEARVPFMDHHLVELTAKMPPKFKLNGMNEKYILKRLMLDRLPEMPNQYKKRGFYTPIRQWFFTAEQENEISEYFSPVALAETEIFNPFVVISMYKKLKNMQSPTDMNSYYQCMRMEWLLLTVLSVQMLHELFVKKQAACFKSNWLPESSKGTAKKIKMSLM